MGTYKLPLLLCKGTYSSTRLGGFQGMIQRIFLRAASEAPDTQNGCLELASWFATCNRKGFQGGCERKKFWQVHVNFGSSGLQGAPSCRRLGSPLIGSWDMLVAFYQLSKPPPNPSRLKTGSASLRELARQPQHTSGTLERCSRTLLGCC